ncbi:MAG: GtrA family protein [Candidatus Endonucleobacter sp. (ex Gigantidas childressi)]|nr:GtrA family protein [Candidatus Endonucleobacter sp. (ex Gigantidas childressi)]
MSDHSNSVLGMLLKKYKCLIVIGIRFGIVGASGFLVDMGVYTLLFIVFGVPHLIARGSSYWVSASWNWFWNRNFTFSHIDKPRKLAQWIKYLGMCMVSFVPNWGTYYLLTTHVQFFYEYKQLALIAGVGLGMLFNFTIASLFIFPGKVISTTGED